MVQRRGACRATFAPGQTLWVVPVRGLYRGEAGSRNNDIKRDIDPDHIVCVDFGFGSQSAAGRIEATVKRNPRQSPHGYDAGVLKREVTAATEKLAP